jgi:hypothetical protein
MKEEE